MHRVTHDAALRKPEDLIFAASSSAERRRLQTAVFLKYREKIAAIARGMLRTPQHWEDAEQAGAVGLLKYLDEYTPGEGTFWGVARFRVIDAIREFIDVGVYWRKRPNAGKSPARRAALEANELHRSHLSYEPELDARADTLTPEDLTAEHELREKLGEFVSTLGMDDQAVLMRGDAPGGRHRMSLMERAREALKGDES